MAKPPDTHTQTDIHRRSLSTSATVPVWVIYVLGGLNLLTFSGMSFGIWTFLRRQKRSQAHAPSEQETVPSPVYSSPEMPESTGSVIEQTTLSSETLPSIVQPRHRPVSRSWEKALVSFLGPASTPSAVEPEDVLRILNSIAPELTSLIPAPWHEKKKLTYKVLHPIGSGGFATVYLAETSDGTQIAVKVMHHNISDSNAQLRFAREVKILTALGQHKNIVQIFSSALDPKTGQPFFVMEYIPGSTLSKLRREYTTFTLRSRIQAIIQVLAGLEHAHRHEKPVIHRDLKPGNIILSSEDGEAKVLDFGVARFGGGTQITDHGMVVGTFSYMSPEQIELHSDAIDARSDLFSVAIMLYELVFGRHPFKGIKLDRPATLTPNLAEKPDINRAIELMQVIVESPPLPMEDGPFLVPKRLKTIIERGLAKDRNERYQNAQQFASALSDCLQMFPEIT